MKPIRVSEDVVPVGEFRAKTKQWLARAGKTGQPVVITQNGRPAGVLLSPAEFDRRIKDELAKWELVIKSAGIKPE